MLKRLLLVVLLTAVMVTGCLSNNDDQHGYISERNLSWEISDAGVTITWFSGRNRRSISISPEIRGMPVIGIGEKAFERVTNRSAAGLFPVRPILSVIIPDNVTYIGAGAFMGNELTNVTIPDNVVFIGASAFIGNRLTNVTIPRGVTVINPGTFAHNQLTNVTIHDNVTFIGRGAFEDNLLTSITIPDSVSRIENWVFRHNQLTSVTIGNDVEFEQWSDDNFGGFGPAFGLFYESQGRKAGTYIYNDGTWSVEFR